MSATSTALPPRPARTVEIRTISTPSLGDRSYLVHDGTDAAVVDPQRDIDRVEALLDELGVRLVAVFETHVHNDYVTGGYQLSRAFGAAYHVQADEDVAYERVPVRDGDVVTVGSFAVRVVATPGHTPTHVSYVVEAAGEPVAVCTGGGLLFGSVGRPDLVDPALTETLARAQHRSAQRLATELDDAVSVLPTHGFGSFCSSGDIDEGADRSTIGRERRVNDALVTTDEDAFVERLVAGLDAYPAYYARMAPANLAGPAPIDLSPLEPVDTIELKRRIHAGQWVVDLRDRRSYAAHHLSGTVNVEFGDQASTYLGWLMPGGTPVTLLAADEEDVAAFQRHLVRIGIDRPAGRADAADVLADADGSYDVTDLDGLARLLEADEDVVVLDTRRDGERAGGAIANSVHVPIHELPQRLDEVPAGTVAVHCVSGYRASIGASLLAAAGRRVVLVDDEVSSTTVASAGLRWVPAAA